MTTLRRAFLILFCLILFSFGAVYAAAQNVSVYLKPDITIEVGGQVKSFYDASGKIVYPIIYQGTTYLPIRAISALMGENIEWDGKSRTIYIGRTLSDPGKAVPAQSLSIRDGDIPSYSKPPVQTVNALLMRDITVMYDFEEQYFYDESERMVYPINYQGSNYLPLRAAARLMGESIDWNAGQKLISISNRYVTAVPGAEGHQNVELLRGFLADVVAVFDEATARIVSLQNSLTHEELTALEALVSEDVRKIDKLTAEIKRVKTNSFSDDEVDAYEKLTAYSESASHYVLIVENIVYMARSGQDYSIFAETFLNFALDAQSKYEAVKNALRYL